MRQRRQSASPGTDEQERVNVPLAHFQRRDGYLAFLVVVVVVVVFLSVVVVLVIATHRHRYRRVSQRWVYGGFDHSLVFFFVENSKRFFWKK